jgi:U3 small nucleolar RNA-associated protein 3
MGKKRNTVKTGDKGLYKSRSAASGGPKGRNKVPHDDNMYDEIDRHHNHQEDLIRLDNDNGEDDLEDDGYANKEAVMDLAGGSSSSSSSSSEEDSEEEHRDDNQASLDEEEPVVSSDDDADEMEDEEDVRDWGRRKAGYWGGDTADLEIGQDQEDAFLEEEAAKQVQAARYEQMDEHDFMLSEDEQADSDKYTMEPTTRDLTKLSRAARRKLIKSHHPELLPLVSHFAQIIQNWNEKSRVVTEALFSSQDVSAQVSVSVCRFTKHP